MTGKLTLGRAHGQCLLREMLRIRHFEAKCAELYQAQKIRGFLHLYDGQEAVAVGVMQALDERDAVVPTYRDHGHQRAAGVMAVPEAHRLECIAQDTWKRVQPDRALRVHASVGEQSADE